VDRGRLVPESTGWRCSQSELEEESYGGQLAGSIHLINAKTLVNKNKKKKDI